MLALQRAASAAREPHGPDGSPRLDLLGQEQPGVAVVDVGNVDGETFFLDVHPAAHLQGSAGVLLGLADAEPIALEEPSQVQSDVGGDGCDLHRSCHVVPPAWLHSKLHAHPHVSKFLSDSDSLRDWAGTLVPTSRAAVREFTAPA